jgi:hypothetical protein
MLSIKDVGSSPEMIHFKTDIMARKWEKDKPEYTIYSGLQK